MLGTGLEDFFDSAYGFSIVQDGTPTPWAPTPRSSDSDSELRRCVKKTAGDPTSADLFCPVEGAPFQHPGSGVVHFSADYSNPKYKNGVERFSGYRFFDADVVGLDNGGSFGWDNGCAGWNAKGTNKCGEFPPAPPPGGKAPGEETRACLTSPTKISAYVWAYVWPKAAAATLKTDDNADADTSTALVNPVPLFDTKGDYMNIHDGDVVQWEQDGPFYYYGMAYDRCPFIACDGGPQEPKPHCGHRWDHRVLIYKSTTLANRSWTKVSASALPGSEDGSLGIFYRSHVNYNRRTKKYVMIVNSKSCCKTDVFNCSGHVDCSAGGAHTLYHNIAATSDSPEGPFTNPVDMAHLSHRAFGPLRANLGDFGWFVDDDGEAYLAGNCMGGPSVTAGNNGIFVERLNSEYTDGLNSSADTSRCLNCVSAPDYAAWKAYEESPSMYKTEAGTYVILTAGATCFGVPQPGNQRWGGTGIFAYVADKPLGPYSYTGDINSVTNMTASVGGASDACGECMGNHCPSVPRRCAIPVQLNSILRAWDGSNSGKPIGLSGGMWGIDVHNSTTNVLGTYAEYWSAWSDVVDAATGLPKRLVHRDSFTLPLK